MGNEHAFLPRHVKSELDDFIDENFDRWYTQFVKFWGNHCSIQSCTTKCSRAIIIDGHMKIKRRLCHNQTLPLVPPRPFELIFDTITVGCPESPAFNSLYCNKCKSSNEPSLETKPKKNQQRTQKPSINSLSEVSLSKT